MATWPASEITSRRGADGRVDGFHRWDDRHCRQQAAQRRLAITFRSLCSSISIPIDGETIRMARTVERSTERRREHARLTQLAALPAAALRDTATSELHSS